MSPSIRDHPENETEGTKLAPCDTDDVEKTVHSNTGYLSDSSTMSDSPLKRGRKRKEMWEEEAEVKRVTANYQERQRMMKLNTALDKLRKCLPDQFKLGNRRISKIRTLRLAASYIQSLGDILKQDSIIRESLPPQPGFEPRLPTLTEVSRQGDSGDMYTPEKELSLIPSHDSLTYTHPDYRYPDYGHTYSQSSPHFQYNSHTASLALPSPATFPLLQPHLPLCPAHFYPPGFHTQHLSIGGTVFQ